MLRNAISSTDQIVYKVIEIRYDAEGHIYGVAHEGWTVTDFPDSPVQIQIFRRGNLRFKLCVYQKPFEYIETFGAWICADYMATNPTFWKKIDLSVCNR